MGLLNDNELADFNEFLMKKYGTSPDGSHNSKFEAITTFNKNILLQLLELVFQIIVLV